MFKYDEQFYGFENYTTSENNSEILNKNCSL